jgi:hypothetical protein
MVLPAAWLNLAADAIKGGFTHVGLRNSGTELTGGLPAYSRQALSYGATANGDWTGTASFNVPAGATVNEVAFYSASSGGSPSHVESVTPETYGGQGVYNLTVPCDVD